MTSIKALPPEDQEALIANWLTHDADPNEVLLYELGDMKELSHLFIQWLMYRDDSLLVKLREAMIERVDGEPQSNPYGPECDTSGPTSTPYTGNLSEDIVKAHKEFMKRG